MITLPTTVATFAGLAADMTSSEIFNYLELNLDVRNAITDFFKTENQSEPIRAAIYELGKVTNVDSLLNY